jgi:hypothetical protein
VQTDSLSKLLTSFTHFDFADSVKIKIALADTAANANGAKQGEA